MYSDITLEKLIELVETYDKFATQKIIKAYEYAYKVHGDQRRKSGELYISHPLCVAYILATMNADSDTICAALLHDVIEDGDNITKEDIQKEFNETIAIIVDGVTKMKLELFPNKEAQNSANTRKIITGMKNDIRIIIVKLADRLHNMTTLEFLKRNKQIQNSIETLEIFVPLAKRLGLQNLKNSLEELAFKHLNENMYYFIEERKNLYSNTKITSLEKIKEELESQLINLNMEPNISYRIKRNYAIYKGLFPNLTPAILPKLELSDINNLLYFDTKSIHDLQSLKILVNNLEECYSCLELVQKNYEIIPGKIKDCIAFPKTNGYQSIHTTILDHEKDKLQTQIRTKNMEKTDSLGIASYWQNFKELAPYYMQQELYKNFPFYHSLLQIDEIIENDKDFVEQAKKEILSEMIYPHTRDGKVIELPQGSNVIDFACQLSIRLDSKIIAMVNGRIVSPNYILKSKDKVDLITIENQKNYPLSYNVITTRAKQKIKTLQG